MQREADQSSCLFAQLVGMILEILLNNKSYLLSRKALRGTIFAVASHHQSLEGYAVHKSSHIRGAGKPTVGTLAKAEIEQFNSGE